jgi:hypothetical protein
MFAGGSFFDFSHRFEFDGEIITEFSSNARFNDRQPRRVELGPGNVSKFRNPRPILVELHGVEIIENRVVHVEGGQ